MAEKAKKIGEGYTEPPGGPAFSPSCPTCGERMAPDGAYPKYKCSNQDCPTNKPK